MSQLEIQNMNYCLISLLLVFLQDSNKIALWDLLLEPTRKTALINTTETPSSSKRFRQKHTEKYKTTTHLKQAVLLLSNITENYPH